MTTKFIGHYKLEKSENFEAFMEAIGVNVALRKLGSLTKPEFTVQQVEGDHFIIKEWNMVKSHCWDFTLGQEFTDKTVDGRDVKTTINYDEEKLVISEKPAGDSGKPVSYTWELTAENGIHVTVKVDDVVAHRYFKRLES